MPNRTSCRVAWRGSLTAAALFAIATLCRGADEQPPQEPPKSNATAAAAALAELRDFSPAGIDRRLGPRYEVYHQGKAEKLTEIWQAPRHEAPDNRHWEIGGPWSKEGGDFSSTQGQVLYVLDHGDFPVDRVTILEWTNGCFTESPEPPWHGGFRPEPAAKKWKESAAGGNVGQPIGMARGMGAWANNGLAIFSTGFMGAAGTVTARGLEPTFQFPATKLPTAIAITNRSEFALVTVHDLERHIGQVAVFSLGVNGKKTNFVHEWQDDHAWSLPSVGLLTDIKLLGYVDLPGIAFPTAVSATGNKLTNRMNGRDGNAGLLREYDLAKQADRDVFFKGSNSEYGSSAGYAVVIGKYEDKAAVIDLRPLFEGVRAMYFTTQEMYDKTRDAGPGPNQWPYTFEADKRWKPTVRDTLSVPRPTAVITSLPGNKSGARFVIASEQGVARLYSAGNLMDEPNAQNKIGQVAQGPIGHNTTCLTYQKGVADTIIAVSRGDREVSWISLADDQLHVVRRLRDSRMIDPVYVEMSDTHGIETSLITVCDFAGRKLINYRFSPVKFATQGGAIFGMGPDGKAEFECGGAMELPGTPICISATNVN